MHKYYVFFLIHMVLASNGAMAQSVKSDKKLIATLDSILLNQVNHQLIPGAVILIKSHRKVIYEKAYGYARKYDRDHQILAQPERMTVDHLFDIASLTKVIGTTSAIMYLVDKGQLNVDDPVSKYIKAFDTQEKKSITVRHLLTHTSGIYEWYPLYYCAKSQEETYSLIADLPLKDSIGKYRRYSDLGFTILGQIIEKVSGMPLELFLQQKIFWPLTMNHTIYNPLQKGQFSKFAATSYGNPYEKRMVYDSTLGFRFKEIIPDHWEAWRNYVLAGEVNDGNAWYANGGISGAAGLFSTIEDLQKLIDLLMNRGLLNGKQFISPKSINSFFTPDRFNNGLGWMMDPTNSFMRNAPKGTFGHTGFTGTSIVVIPKYDISMILLINRQHTGLSTKGEYYNLSPVREQLFKAILNYSMK